MIRYELHGDYYLPCLVIPKEETHAIGICERKHLDYIKEHRPVLYADLVLICNLHSYLADINAQAQTKLDLLMKQIAKKEGITEQLKSQDQLTWIRAMNGILNRAEEIVNAKIIFA